MTYKRHGKPWVVFDIDDVLANCSDTIRSYYNAAHNANIQPASAYATHVAYPEIGELGFAWFTHAYQDPTMMGSIPVITGAVKMVKDICDTGIFRIVYCTHRPVNLEETTKKWLKENGFPKAPINLGSGSKAAFRSLHPRTPMAFFDDSVEVLNTINSIPCQSPNILFCFSKPHNISLPLSSAIRVTNYAQPLPALLSWGESLRGN